MKLFPGSPNLRAVACSCLLSIAYNRSFHQLRIIEDFVFLCNFILHVPHERNIRMLAVPIDKIIDPSHGTQYAVKFLTGHTVLFQINGLKFDAPLFKIALRFLCIEALAFTKNLNIQ